MMSRASSRASAQDDRLWRAALRLDAMLATLLLLGILGSTPFTAFIGAPVAWGAWLAMNETRRAYVREVTARTRRSIEGIAFGLAMISAVGTPIALSVAWKDIDLPRDYWWVAVTVLCNYLSWSAFVIARRSEARRATRLRQITAKVWPA